MNALTDFIIHFLTAHGGLITYLLVALILFAESGLLVGFFLPGDSLLIALGLLAPSTHLSLILLVVAAATGAIIGDSTGYLIGRTVGNKLVERPDTWYFKRAYVEQAREYFLRYGPSTLVIARFIPVIRTFVPTVAGISEMKYSKFLSYNFIGGALWSISIILGGAYLAVHIPAIGQHIGLIESGVLLVSLAVAASHLPGLIKK